MPATRGQLPIAALAMGAGMIATVLVGIVGSHLQIWIFMAAAGLLVAEAAVASLLWPRAILVGVVLSPILDRYVVPGLLPPDAEKLAHLLSEALLLAVGTALLSKAARHASLREAFDHGTVRFAVAFVVLGGVSALVNAVPIGQALAGIAFIVDAVALFVLARLVGFDARQALIAILVLLGLVLAGALIAIAQALITPHLFGLSALRGRFGELYRLAAFFGDPNVFAAFLSAAVPFALFGITGLKTKRGRRIALLTSFLLILALWLSFSRGGWLGAVGGFAVAALFIDHRPMRIAALVVAVALVVALTMPRNLLCPSCQREGDLVGSTIGRIGTVGGGRDLRVLFILNGLPILADHPLLGVGPGRFGGAAADLYGTPVYAAYGTDKLFTSASQRTVDDFWLHLAVEFGVLGLIAYLAMVAAVLRQIMRAARSAAWGRRVALAGISGAVIGLSINGFTTMLLEANSVAFLFWFLLGIGSQLARGPDAQANVPAIEAAA
ncbi:MAG TPA: O-antigen ligase family protein [Methylomirabilota bacterium]|jgi:O-antigen ligase|nr:O-antigen ligase family protein [Methylomirabilota bacterium]